MDPSFFNLYVPCDNMGLLSDLTSMAFTRQYRKNDLILKMGEKQKVFYLLRSGVTCAYVLQSDGSEITDCIMANRGMPVMPSPDFSAPSPNYVLALSDCELVCLDMQAINLKARTNPELASLINRYLSRAWSDHYKTESALRALSARDRYDWFLKEYPGVVDKIAHSRIASFLGMSPITLSRVRSSM